MLVDARRQHQDRHPTPVAQPSTHLDAIHARATPGRASTTSGRSAAHASSAIGPVRRGSHAIAVTLERGAQGADHVRVVVDHQNAWRRFTSHLPVLHRASVGHQHDEPRAAKRTVFDRQPRHPARRLPRERWPGPRPVPKPLIRQALELGKHALARLARDARTAVAHFDAYCTVLDSPDDRNGRTRRRVHAHVFQDVAQRLVEQSRVEASERQGVGHVERRPAGRRGSGWCGRAPPTTISPSAFHCGSGVMPDSRRLMASASPTKWTRRSASASMVPSKLHARGVGQRHARVAQRGDGRLDRRQRRPQIVRDDRQRLVARAQRRLGLPPRGVRALPRRAQPRIQHPQQHAPRTRRRSGRARCRAR